VPGALVALAATSTTRRQASGSLAGAVNLAVPCRSTPARSPAQPMQTSNGGKPGGKHCQQHCGNCCSTAVRVLRCGRQQPMEALSPHGRRSMDCDKRLSTSASAAYRPEWSG